MGKKICFITSLFGKNLNCIDKPGYFKKNEDYDYFLFTNFKSKHFKTSWQIINFDSKFPKLKFRNNIIKSRYPKFMAWEFIKNISDEDYDIIIYCDAFLSPKLDFDWEKIHLELDLSNKKYIENGNGNGKKIKFMQSFHEYDKVRNGGIIEDCKLILSSEKDNFTNITKTLSFFKKQGMGGVKLMRGGYVVNTVLAYNIKCSETTNFLKEFWSLYRCPGFTIRDQPIWNYLLIKKNIKSIIFEEIIQDNGKDIVRKRNDGIFKKGCLYSMKDDAFIETGKYIGHNIYNYSL